MGSHATPVHLGRYGIWLPKTQVTGEFAAGVERLGYTTLWIGGSPTVEDLRSAEEVLAATSTLSVATGIVNIWKTPPGDLAGAFHQLQNSHPDRFLLGIGAGHREADGRQAGSPYQGMTDYLDELDTQGVPRDRRVLAALGPRMLALAAERTAGAHPYIVPAEHTEQARALMGPDPLLAPEHTLTLGASLTQTRSTGREFLGRYLQMRNYRANLERLGFTGADFDEGGSGALIDALVAQGDPARATVQVRRHVDAGADHVAVQLLAPQEEALASLRLLAPHLGLPEQPDVVLP